MMVLPRLNPGFHLREGVWVGRALKGCYLMAEEASFMGVEPVSGIDRLEENRSPQGQGPTSFRITG